MRKSLTLAVGLLAFGLAGTAAQAAPMSAMRDAGVSSESLVDTVQGYRRDCYWTGTGWGYKSKGKVLVCRPHKPPGSGWIWHSEGGRHGWYHSQRKAWHHNKW